VCLPETHNSQSNKEIGAPATGLMKAELGMDSRSLNVLKQKGYAAASSRICSLR
jgi:hypothetical protein